MFEHQQEFFDLNVVNETRNQTYERLAKVAESVGIDKNNILELLIVADRTGQEGQLNTGNEVTNDIKLMVKAGRVVGVHVSPTAYFNGIEESGISSSFTPTQWEQWLAKNAI